MPRFFAPPEAFSDNIVKIAGDDAFHIARSLRMAEGDELTVCDMQGGEHSCRLIKIRDELCECEIISTREGASESPAEITLLMAYPKGDKLETVIQKATELGAAAVIPFESSRCVKVPRAEKVERQNARLVRIAEEAAKQCGRSRLPRVELGVSFKEALSRAAESELALFCYEGKGTRSLKAVLEERSFLKAVMHENEKIKSISVIVGAEGGFSEAEAEEARLAGLVPVNLGPRILRCETAPLYVLSALSYFFEL